MKLTKQFFWFYIIALSTTMLTASCGDKSKSNGATKGESGIDTAKTVIKVGVTPTRDCLPAFIVVERGIAERRGLSVSLDLFGSRMDQDTAIVRDRIDGMLADSVNIAYLNAKEKDFLSVCGQTDAEWKLIAGRTSRVTRLDQLGDKIVAHACFSATEWLTGKALDKVKTKADVYRVQVNDVKVRYNMLLVAAVDAAWLSEPYTSKALKYGHKIIADSKSYGAHLGVVAFTSKALKNKKKQDSIKLFIQCLNEANDSIRKYGAEHYADCIK